MNVKCLFDSVKKWKLQRKMRRKFLELKETMSEILNSLGKFTSRMQMTRSY